MQDSSKRFNWLERMELEPIKERHVIPAKGRKRKGSLLPFLFCLGEAYVSLVLGERQVVVAHLITMVSLKMQKRLAASVLDCGKRKVWIDPNETDDVAMANSRT